MRWWYIYKSRKGLLFHVHRVFAVVDVVSFNRLVLRVYRSLILGPQVLFLDLDVRRPGAFPDAPLIT